MLVIVLYFVSGFAQIPLQWNYCKYLKAIKQVIEQIRIQGSKYSIIDAGACKKEGKQCNCKIMIQLGMKGHMAKNNLPF